MKYPYNWHGVHCAYYYAKCWLFKRYNRITVKTLPPTLTDRVEFLPHVMFQVLDDFVQKEAIPGWVDWDGTPEHRAARDKMDELLNWWKNVYLKFDSYQNYDESQATPQKEKWVSEDDRGCRVWTLNFNEYDTAFHNKVICREDDMEEELNKKLQELLEIRGYLWT